MSRRRISPGLTPEQKEALRTIRDTHRERLRKLREELREEARQIRCGLRQRPETTVVAIVGPEVAQLHENAEIGAKSRAAGEKSAQLRRHLDRNVQMAEAFYSRRQAAPEKVSNTAIIADIGEQFGMSGRGAAKAIRTGFREILRRKTEK